MAVALLPNSIVRFTATVQAFGQTLMNQLDYQVGSVSAPNYQTELALANAYMASGVGPWGKLINCLGTNVNVGDIWAQPIYPQRLRPVRVFNGTVGAGGGTCSAQNVCGVIHKLSDQAARWGQGSVHVGGLASLMYGGGVLLTAGLIPLTAMGDAMELAFLGGVCTFSPVLFNLKMPTRVTPWNISSVATTLRVMRRRTVGVGI